MPLFILALLAASLNSPLLVRNMIIAQLEPRSDLVREKGMLNARCSVAGHGLELRRCPAWLLVLVLTLGLTRMACGQTASTGAVMGVTLDPSGAVLGA